MLRVMITLLQLKGKDMISFNQKRDLPKTTDRLQQIQQREESHYLQDYYNQSDNRAWHQTHQTI